MYVRFISCVHGVNGFETPLDPDKVKPVDLLNAVNLLIKSFNVQCNLSKNNFAFVDFFIERDKK